MTVPLDQRIELRMQPELKRLLGEAAHRRRITPHARQLLKRIEVDEPIPINELIVRIVAHALERPDLAMIPRRAAGRPPKMFSGQDGGNRSGRRI